MIPSFEEQTGHLPAGEHAATWPEVAQRFGWNDHRRRLLAGMLRMVTNLRDAGCVFFLLDGSFVTNKEYPEDYDACCDYEGMDPLKIDSRMFMGKQIMKAEFGGEVHPEKAFGDVTPLREFYQTDKNGVAKGVVILDLGSLP